MPVATAVMVVVNVALNLVLIPPLLERGAGIAMLVTEALFAGVALVLAARDAPGVPWGRVFAGPLAAGALMAATAGLLADRPLIAGAAGLVVFGCTLVAIERRTAPADLALLSALLRNSRQAA